MIRTGPRRFRRARPTLGTIGWCRQFPAGPIPLLTYSGHGTARDVLGYISFWFAQLDRRDSV